MRIPAFSRKYDAVKSMLIVLRGVSVKENEELWFFNITAFSTGRDSVLIKSYDF